MHLVTVKENLVKRKSVPLKRMDGWMDNGLMDGGFTSGFLPKFILKNSVASS